MTTHVPSQTVKHIVSSAGLAPSVHNTQPWRFVCCGDVIDLYADRTRQLAVLDPGGRQLHVSCGAALEHLRAAARSLGIDAEWDLLPTAEDADHLARVVLQAGHPASPAERELAEAALHRHTYRGRFEPTPIVPTVLELLRIAVTDRGANLRSVKSEDELVALEVLLSRADAEERRDASYCQELARWTGDRRSDGVPPDALDPTAGAGSSLALRQFPGASDVRVDDPPAVDHPHVVVITTDGDTPRDWLIAGVAVGALLLTAAAHDVLAQPLGQLTDKEAYRQRLSLALGTLGHPQLALRLGHAHVPVNGTPRRDLGSILERRLSPQMT